MCCRALFFSLLVTTAARWEQAAFFRCVLPFRKPQMWSLVTSRCPPHATTHHPAVAAVAGCGGRWAQSRSLGQVVGQRARARDGNDNSGAGQAGR